MNEPEESLFERLQKTFPIENMPPYDSVVVISSKVFNPAWEEKLKKEGIKVYSSGFQGQAVFFLKRADQPMAVSLEDKPSEQDASFKKPKSLQHGDLWTPEDEAKLRDLYGKGVNYGEIAEQLGRSRNAVYKKAFKMRQVPYSAASKETCSPQS
jgi:hypothetical protein